MNKLIDGYRRFREDHWPERRDVFEQLAHRGQAPRTMVIACCDSRVDPTMIFNAEPGELFVVRNVANLVPPYAPDSTYHSTSAALEFAVRVLQVEEVIIMGHAMCGGIGVLINGEPAAGRDFLKLWMSIAEPARQIVLERGSADPQADCEEESVRLSMNNLMTFPWISERVAAGSLMLSGTIFDIRSGILKKLQPSGEFAPV